MIRKITATLLLGVATAFGGLGTGGTVEAQTVYVITAFDASDAKQWRAFQNDANSFQEIWGLHIDNYSETSTKKFALYNTYESAWRGPELYRFDIMSDEAPKMGDRFFERMLEGIRKCPVESDDALVVFGAGHGAFKNGEHCLAAENGSLIERSRLLDAMKSRGARLTVLITDCCSDYRETTEFQNRKEFPPSAQTLYGSAGITPLFDNLFFQSRGVVDVCAAIEGSKAFTYSRSVRIPGSNENRDVSGGCFTIALCSQYSWENMGVSISSAPRIARSGANAYVKALGREGIRLEPQDAEIGALVACYSLEVGWNELMDYVQETTAFLARQKGRDQRVAVWQITGREFQSPENASAEWSRPTYSPEIGDVVVEVDGRSIRSASDFRNAVSSASSTITLTLVDARSGKRYLMRTKIGAGRGDRLGVSVVDDEDGARVVGIRASGPASRCQFLWE